LVLFVGGITLTTPAIFDVNGWYPDAFNNAADTFTALLHGVCVTLTAAAIARAQHYSGWVKHEGKIGPGQPHRVVPAGSVFWFTLANGSQSKGFIDELHDKGLCTGAWQADGWGMGLVGAA
jgi:CRISPR-associated protein (Cas_Cmr3)